ncbi:GntR family transcriptional regulator [Dietzia psychralcaliphila]|uniref:GntR family transcriptional regulator n=1 Tax=Dietzia psychralcaliphila TaxID=139021 RepID=A0AAD0JS83_9ACTN|nr:GntR family transcriptional regulator [Dietzia psychralcaliphila]AWH94628.1 GntR family transcriptional regulator [Dietzia psychralcaliphila]PTM86078.1 DNA-binding GntR family transcriptional regulator [Dietzia psychralcaliphila]
MTALGPDPGPEAAAGLEPVVRESTPALIARTLRRAISDGTFPPGTQLGEAALARSLGVSRGPLREAMQRLTQEGLLVSHRNRGLFVADLSAEAVEDMYLLRTTVETAALDRVLDLGLGVVTADALDAAVDAMASLADEPRSEAMVAADLDFHHVLVEAARSPRLSRVHETVLVETSMCLHAMRGTYSDAASRLIEHRAIADAVRAGDPDRARALLVDHMRDGLVRVREGGEAR